MFSYPSQTRFTTGNPGAAGRKIPGDGVTIAVEQEIHMDTYESQPGGPHMTKGGRDLEGKPTQLSALGTAPQYL